MRVVLLGLCFVFATMTFFGENVRAAGIPVDIWTIFEPADKFCVTEKVPSLTSGFLTSRGVEQALEVLSCFPENSSQSRAYGLLAQLLYSREYGATISSLRGKNAGIINYFNKRLHSDEVFFTQAKRFYDELKEIDQIFFVGRHPELIGKIPGLSEVSGEGAFSDFSPGWLWKLALKHAAQNPAIAIELIGICGHDDVHYHTLTNGQGTSTFSCPMRGMTLFYTAQALGKDVDLDENTKNRIASIQAPQMGIGVLPSKTYHFYGGALFSCLMKEQGLSDKEIAATNSLVAKLYRVIDMRNRMLINKSYALENPKRVEADLRESCKQQRGRFLCPNFRTSETYNQEREDRFVAGKLTEFDSYFLIDRWGMIKKIPLIGLPFDIDLNLTTTQASDRPQEWSPERFDKAVKRIQTYAIDLEWIEQQHIVGSKFALNQCKH